MNLFAYFRDAVVDALEAMKNAGDLPADLSLEKVLVEAPRDASHGDLTTNAAMVLTKLAKTPPRQIAEGLCKLLEVHDDIEKAEIAGPGFVNLQLSPAFWPKLLKSAIEEGGDYGRSSYGNSKRVNVEYVSANPTGPLHVGHCRGAVFGDALANLLEFSGYDVTREYYINDAGAQVDILARSAYLRYLEALGQDIGEIPSGLYPGDYLVPVGKKLAEIHGDKYVDQPEGVWIDEIRQVSIDMMMDMIRDDLAQLNIEQEVFFSEKSLHESAGSNESKVCSIVHDLRKRDLIYEGTLEAPKGIPQNERDEYEDRVQTLFRTTDYGDDVDRPLVKSDGSYTYFASDVAYAKDKIDRGFEELVFVLGADHGGYVKRLEAVAAALSDRKVNLIARLCQLVKLFRAGEPVRMSKRAGDFVTLRDVVDEVGSDVVRFMMLTRKNDAPLDFDFQKVTDQTKDNPVFYVQYAHARICSVLRNAESELGAEEISLQKLIDSDFSLLIDSGEQSVIRQIAAYPKIVEAATAAHEPHRLAFYLYELASEFHSLWNKGKDSPQLRFILNDQLYLTHARLAILVVIRYILNSGLQILGVKSADRM